MSNFEHDGFHPDASDTLVVVDQASAPNGAAPQLEPVQVDYFGFQSTRRFMLPDGASWVDLKTLNEGERRRYLNETNREVKFAKSTGDAHLRMRPGDDKALLISLATTGWNFVRQGAPVPFNPGTLEQFLKVADPKVIDLIEKEIRLMNPWLQGDIALEDMIRERDNLNELIEAKEREEAGKDTSSSQ